MFIRGDGRRRRLFRMRQRRTFTLLLQFRENGARVWRGSRRCRLEERRFRALGWLLPAKTAWQEGILFFDRSFTRFFRRKPRHSRTLRRWRFFEREGLQRRWQLTKVCLTAHAADLQFLYRERLQIGRHVARPRSNIAPRQQGASTPFKIDIVERERLCVNIDIFEL